MINIYIMILFGILCLDMSAAEMTVNEYQKIGQPYKDRLRLGFYSAMLTRNVGDHRLDLEVKDLLVTADLLTGAGKSFSSGNSVGVPYDTTTRDKETARVIYEFVKNLPAGVVNRGLEDWAHSGLGYLRQQEAELLMNFASHNNNSKQV